MPIRVVSRPAPVVSLDEAKEHLRVLHDDEDAYIASLCEAVMRWIDGPEGWLGRSVATQTLELTQNRFGTWDGCEWNAWIELPYGPVQSITSINYIDGDGTTQLLDDDSYQLTENLVWPAYGYGWPGTRPGNQSVKVTYVAGHPLGDIPEPIKQAMKIVIGEWYDKREGTGSRDLVNLPMGANALLAPYRIFC